LRGMWITQRPTEMFLQGQDRYVHPEPLRGERLHMPIYWMADQWAVTSYGIEATDGTYTIARRDFKTWEDFMMVFKHVGPKIWDYQVELLEAGKTPAELFGNRKACRERVKMTRSLRFKVLNRDGFRCKYCGSTAEEAPLHVDHVVPIARGGKTRLSNLVTSCSPCNLGKSTKLLEVADGTH